MHAHHFPPYATDNQQQVPTASEATARPAATATLVSTEPAARPPGLTPRRSWWTGALAGAIAGAVTAGAISLAFGGTDTSPAETTPVASATSVVTVAGNGATIRAGLDVHAVLAIAQDSVVSIDYTVTQQVGRRTVQGTAAGSGVIISTDGIVLTNAHVVSGASQVNVTLNNGTKYVASVLGSDTASDIALLRISGASDLQAATLGSSSASLVGDDVVAIGNALDLGGKLTVTRGIISAVERTLSDSTTTLEHLIQTDAAINSGNSGGPLLNAQGEVIGINTAIIQNSENVGFAIAIDSIRDLITRLGG